MLIPIRQVKQAALAIGRAAKAEGLSPQSAAQIAAAGAQEAAKKNQQSQVGHGKWQDVGVVEMTHFF